MRLRPQHAMHKPTYTVIDSNCSPKSEQLTVYMPIYVPLELEQELTCLYASIAPGDMYMSIT